MVQWLHYLRTLSSYLKCVLNLCSTTKHVHKMEQNNAEKRKWYYTYISQDTRHHVFILRFDCLFLSNTIYVFIPLILLRQYTNDRRRPWNSIHWFYRLFWFGFINRWNEIHFIKLASYIWVVNDTNKNWSKPKKK